MKLNQIESIYNSWIGGFISSNHAISKIGDVIKSNEVKNLTIYNSEHREIGKLQNALINVK